MKLRNVTKRTLADYPSFKDYHDNRSLYLKGVLAAGAVMVGALTSCSNDQPKIQGEIAAPQSPPPKESKIMGKLKAPVQTAPLKEVRLRGDIVAPTPPENTKKKGEAKTPAQAPPLKDVMVDGEMVAPIPPANPKRMGDIKVPAQTPALKRDGQIVAPTPPEAKGKIKAPATLIRQDNQINLPQKLDGKPIAPRPPANNNAPRERGNIVAPKAPTKVEK